MENIDPLGIHTGESVVVAPSQTLSDLEYNMLRTCAIKVIREIGIIGECNIQYALDPHSLKYYIIEVNARLSRSSALASKATGYPLAYIAAKLALGHRLPELKNNVTGETTACFEPSLDYCVVKCPRWDLGKFSRVSTQIGSSMKSVGEVMGIGRSFEEAFQKALRMVSDSADGFSPFYFHRKAVDEDISKPTDKRMFALARGMYYGDFDVEKAYELSKIDRWFLLRMHNIIDIYQRLEKFDVEKLPACLLLEAKQAGFSDKQISKRVNSTESKIRELRLQMSILPCVKQIDTVAGEWPAQTNYLYLTYNGAHNDVNFDMKNCVIVLGSGVYRIGSSVEFDASCVGCVRELKALGYETIMVNCNPETVSTDYDICDRLYFEEISFETVFEIFQKERPKGLILAFGGQAPNNIALTLSRAQVTIFGTSPDSIDSAEDRYKFSRKLEGLKISQPNWKKSDNIEDAKLFCAEVGYPCLIRPSYVLSGAAMNVAHNEDDLASFLQQATVVAKEHPVVVSKFISDAKEIDVDAVAFEGKVLVMAVSEHIENAGIHSGDATLVTPPQDLNKVTLERITEIAHRIAECFNVNGPFNMQLIAKDNELKVIECNLRVSRSFPFVSKTLDFDFVALATRVMMAVDNPSLRHSLRNHGLLKGRDRVGVKVPQFSFSRLAGADVMLGVEMSSTGEVACFGKDRYEAYLKALLSTGFVVPPAGSSVFLSVGGYHAKAEMLRSVQTLQSLGFNLYGSKGTADYFQSNNIHVTSVEWPFDKGIEDAKTSAGARTLIEFFEEKEFQLVINLPIKGKGAYRVSAFRTHGYMTRRMAIDSGIPLITDIKCAKIFIEALRLVGRHPPVNTQIDCIASRTLKRLPGLIDVHVHEDWTTCTQAALAGGITQILAMPNTNPPLTNAETFEMVEKLASSKSLVDYALYIGATAENSEEAAKLAHKAAGLKMYLNDTFSALKMDSISDWVKHLKSFPSSRPIVCHAEKETLAAILFMAQLSNRPVHICHVARAEEIELIVDAKKRGLNVTCEVAPHHLFLCSDNLPEGIREVRPKLGTQSDIDALWKNLDFIDVFATDHAPHTWDEKNGSQEKIPPGFPGIEYMLPLLITAVHQGKLTMRQLIDRLHTNPQRIFGLPTQPDTYIEVEMNKEWTIPKEGGSSKAGWTPFAGRTVRGKVVNVVIRGEVVYSDGVIVAEPGFGRNMRTDFFYAHGKTPETIDAFGNVLRELRETVADKNVVSSTSSDGSPYASPPRPATPIDPIALTGKHLVSVLDLSKSQLSRIFDVADACRQSVERHHSLTHVLHGYVMGAMFYEPSTRTCCSFESAMLRLGGTNIKIDAVSSSVTKGETLEDTVRMMCGYSDILVLRHNEKGAAHKGCKVAKIPLINAGDGAGEHPTQALLDIYTIRCENSTVNGLTIAMVGDLKHGRTVHSLAKLLCVYEGITLHYVSPTEGLGMPEDVCNYVNKHSNFTQKKFTNLAEGIHHVDVVYVTRIQKERFANPDEYERVKGSYVINAKLLNDAARVEDEENESILVPKRNRPVVMHPLPRVDEISTELDGDERAAYFRQAENGVFVRMAILSLLLGRANHITDHI
ncbi:hypothetical protein WR25_27009 isoform A [Diploscapter pachys]|uniref:Uncharacterized protein n=2 Tax=Diploscapter pachys TaxID=2018661 RepID=A0A2A2L7F4_9BILA|nr:hypothetical protein WR25_27009 isoform A [Diploscapter pachys]